VGSKNTTRKGLAIIKRKVSQHTNKENNLPLSSSKKLRENRVVISAKY